MTGDRGILVARDSQCDLIGMGLPAAALQTAARQYLVIPDPRPVTDGLP